jgi:hypothetical protein
MSWRSGQAYSQDLCERVLAALRLQDRLQVTPGDLLRDAVGDCRNAQRSRPTTRLPYVNPPHQRRKVASGRQPIPKFVEVARKVGLELRNRLSIHASRSLV